jgi:hypothetical protein
MALRDQAVLPMLPLRQLPDINTALTQHWPFPKVMTIGCFINARSLASCVTLDHLFAKPLVNARVTLRVRPGQFHEPVASKL